MSKETPNEELEREFSDADSALSVGTDSDAEPSGEDRDQEQFQKEYKAIFEDDASEEKESGITGAAENVFTTIAIGWFIR